MLVLTRTPGEAIHIGDDVTVTVLEVRGDQVRLGIDAPRHIPVHRSEVWAQIGAATSAATANADATSTVRTLLGR